MVAIGKAPKAVVVFHPTGVRLPMGLTTLSRFRAWARSDDFPEQGKFDWLAGEVEIDMSPEDINTHGTLKVAIVRDLSLHVEPSGRGVVLTDRARVSHEKANLSCEPDCLVVFFESLEQGRARLIPKAGGPAGRYVEIEGTPDLVVECVSDSSEAKDLVKLPPLLHRAGVPEYWVADVRGERAVLQIFRRAARTYVEERPSRQGWVRSKVLGRRVRLARLPERAGVVRWRLEIA